MTRRRLKEAGFGDEQVQALVDVTGADRRALSADMAGLKASGERVKSEIALLRTEVRSEIAGVHTRIDGLRDEMNARFEKVDVRFDGFRDEMNARFDGFDSRLKLVVWFVGVGVTVYVGTTVSLVMILFRNAPV